MDAYQGPNDSRDERTRDKEMRRKKTRERDKEEKKKDNYEDSGGTNRENSREMMIRQTNVQPNGRFAGFSFFVYLFRLLSRFITEIRLIKEIIAAINGNQDNRFVMRTNYLSYDREGPNQTFELVIFLAPIRPHIPNISAARPLSYLCLPDRTCLKLVFRTPDDWTFTFTRTATTNLTFCQRWMFAPALTSQTNSPDIVIPAFPENEDSTMMAAGGGNFRSALTRARETRAFVYQLFRLLTFGSVPEEILQQLINTVQRVLQYEGSPAINIIAGFLPAVASGDNLQTMLGVVYVNRCLWITAGRLYLPQGIVYGPVPRILATSSRFEVHERSSLDNMDATANPMSGEGPRQMIHDDRQFDDNIADGAHEVYVRDQVTQNEDWNQNTDTLLNYPILCEDPQVTPTCTDEYGWPAGQAEAPKGDLSNHKNTCKFPVMETGWEANVEDVQDNDATERNEAEIPIQCKEDLLLARYRNVSGSTSRDYTNGAPDSRSHGGARSRPATQEVLQMRQTVLYAQCEEDLCFEYAWKLEESNHRLRRRLLCPECHALPWSVVLIPCGHLLCSYCYQGQGICPMCLKKVVTSSHVLLS